MRYIVKSSKDILNSVDYFCNYYKLIKSYIDKNLIFSSVDRWAFARPQFALKSDIYKYLGSKREKDSYAYGPEIWDISIREKICRLENIRHNTNYTPDNVAIVSGAWCWVELVLEELSQLKSWSTKKTSIAVIGPTHYQMFHRAINMLGMNVYSYDFIYPDLWSTPLYESEIDAILYSNPDAIFITNPNNPNGEYFPSDLLRLLVKKSEKLGIYLIVDEIQDFFQKPGKWLNYNTWIQSPYVIRIDSFSKKRGLAEYRNWWVIADKQILGDRLNWVIGRLSGLMWNAPRAANTIISKILDLEIQSVDSDENYFNYLNKKLDTREKYIIKKLIQMPRVSILNREGCYNLTIKVDWFSSDAELSKLLMDHGTLIMPCSWYWYSPNDVIMRITFAERWNKINHALKALKTTILEH